MHEVIFEADTPAGKAFDIGLLIAIVLSVVCVMLDSVEAISEKYHTPLLVLEWGFTLLFTVEYVLRLVCIGRPLRYAFSFFGLVDLVAIIPTYLSVLNPTAAHLITIRAIRLLRVFRILKLAHFISDSNIIADAIRQSRRKILVFFATVLTLALVMGSVMYIVEDADAGFTSIPRGMYWAIVTMTTVGYGDIAPATALGQVIAAGLMLVGYSIIAVPTGIVSAEIAIADKGQRVEDGGKVGGVVATEVAGVEREVAGGAEVDLLSTNSCPVCLAERHDVDAVHCKYCGGKL